MSQEEETAVVEKPKTMLEFHRGWLEDPKFHQQLIKAAGKGVDSSQFARNFLTVLQKNDKLAECTRNSLVIGILEAAGLGLAITSALGQAHLVPFRNNKAGTSEATLILGYQGLLDLAYRSDKIFGIRAACVYQKEDFEMYEGPDGQVFHHAPLWDKPVHKRGPFRGVYAIATLAGGHEKRVLLSADEVNKVRKTSGPWVEYPDAMERKTAIRRLCKELPLTTEARERVNIDERRDLGIIDGIAATDTSAEPVGDSALDKFESEMNLADVIKEGYVDEESPPDPKKDPAVKQKANTKKKSAKYRKDQSEAPITSEVIQEEIGADLVCAGCGTTEGVGPNGLCSPCQSQADGS